jgi:hypothetical protein
MMTSGTLPGDCNHNQRENGSYKMGKVLTAHNAQINTAAVTQLFIAV